MMNQEAYETDIAIVGAGVGGAYSAWRLMDKMSAPGHQKIDLFEMSDRIGGRLYSLKLPGMPNMPAELGGMRYFSSHAVTRELVNTLGLPTLDFPNSGIEGNISFVRNHHLRDMDFRDPDKVPYQLSFNERGKTPGELIQYVIDTLVPQSVCASSNEWRAFRKSHVLEGKKLYEYGWWSLMDWVLSREAVELINDAGGYDVPFRNWNAAVAMDVFRNNAPGWNVPSKMITTGFQSLPEALVQRFIDQGGRYHSRHRLCSITPFEQQGKTRVKLVFENAQGAKMVVNARHAILGLPKRSLELLDQDSVHLRTPEIQSDIDSVTSKPAIKLYLGYPYPWWKVLGIKGGKSVTDLQIKQSYYFGAEEDRPAGEAGNTNALLLAAYSDGRVLDYWHPLSRGSEFAGAENPFVPDGLSPLPDVNRATNNQVVQAQKELKALHSLKYIPKPYTAAYMDWSQDPYGGGYSFWKLGHRSLSTQKRMRHLGGLPIHICGDSYSDLQGWVEGALTCTELMLEEHFQLDRPDWIDKDYLSRFSL